MSFPIGLSYSSSCRILLEYFHDRTCKRLSLETEYTSIVSGHSTLLMDLSKDCHWIHSRIFMKHEACLFPLLSYYHGWRMQLSTPPVARWHEAWEMKMVDLDLACCSSCVIVNVPVLSCPRGVKPPRGAFFDNERRTDSHARLKICIPGTGTRTKNTHTNIMNFTVLGPNFSF